MGVEIKLDMQAIKKLEQAAIKSAEVAMEQTIADLRNSEKMPFDNGDMQNNQTFVEADENGARLVTGSLQARRLYYHPEYNFQQGNNSNAGGKWLEQYLTGDKKDFVRNKFAEVFKKESGV